MLKMYVTSRIKLIFLILTYFKAVQQQQFVHASGSAQMQNPQNFSAANPLVAQASYQQANFGE